MCEFCLKHGEGKKWYLQARNYSEDMLSDLRRLKFLEHFTDPEVRKQEFLKAEQGFSKLRKMPWILRSLFRRIITAKMKKMHFGQVVPMEDVEQILEITNSVIRVSCACREYSIGKEEKRYCYGVSIGPDGGKLLEVSKGFYEKYSGGVSDGAYEIISREEALAAFRAHELEGLCHTVWTFETPFIGGICNCDRADCMAMRGTLNDNFPILFRAEYLAQIDADACDGCRQCRRLCQFGALDYSAATRKSVIDESRCYGCGICRSVCRKNAIRLIDRAVSPVPNLW